jgi:hypothetical protein
MDLAGNCGIEGQSPATLPPYDVPAMADQPPVSAAVSSSAAAGEFIDSLMETELYSIGAFFCDQSPELVDELVGRSGEIERRGLEAFAAAEGTPVQEAFEILLTGLAVRYYKAVAG